MSSDIRTPYDSATLDVSNTPGIPFPRLVGVELRKMTDTRAGKWLLITIGLITALAVALVWFLASDDSQNFGNYMATTATPQGLLLPVLGVLLVTSEWGQRAAMTTFTLVPHRSRIISAKVVAALLFGLAAILVAIAIAALTTSLADGDDKWATYGWEDVGSFALLQSLGVLQGLAFGMLFLNSAAAIVAFFVLPVAFTVVTSISGRVQDFQPWVDLGTAQTPLFEGSALTGEQWAQLGTTSLLWIALPMAVGAWRVMRSEVK